MAATVPADVTITGVESLTFSYTSHTGRDDEGHGHPAPERSEKGERCGRRAGRAGSAPR